MFTFTVNGKTKSAKCTVDEIISARLETPAVTWHVSKKREKPNQRSIGKLTGLNHPNLLALRESDEWKQAVENREGLTDEQRESLLDFNVQKGVAKQTKAATPAEKVSRALKPVRELLDEVIKNEDAIESYAKAIESKFATITKSIQPAIDAAREAREAREAKVAEAEQAEAELKALIEAKPELKAVADRLAALKSELA